MEAGRSTISEFSQQDSSTTTKCYGAIPPLVDIVISSSLDGEPPRAAALPLQFVRGLSGSPVVFPPKIEEVLALMLAGDESNSLVNNLPDSIEGFSEVERSLSRVLHIAR